LAGRGLLCRGSLCEGLDLLRVITTVAGGFADATGEDVHAILGAAFWIMPGPGG